MNNYIKGDGVFKIRGNRIYVHGTIDGIFYRKSTGKKVNPANKIWIKKANPLKVLAEILEKDNPLKIKTDLESFGLSVLELTSSKRAIETQKDILRIFNNKILPYFCNFRMEDIKPIDIVKFLEIQKTQLSADRVRRIKNTFCLILDFAEENELILKNPIHTRSVSQVDLSYSVKNKKAYNTDEIKLILDNAKGWFKVFMDISFKLGLRTGETMALKWDDINLKTGTLSLKRSITRGVITEQNENKNSNKNHFRDIQILPSTLELLNSYYSIRPSDEWLFINKDGKYYKESKTIVDYHLKPLLKKIGVEYKTLYATRHSYASIMKYAGENLESIQKVMGHSIGSNITQKHYIDPRILKLEHSQKEAIKQEILFNTMLQIHNS